jgi:hypothetical protein
MALLLDILEPLLNPLLQGSHHIPVISQVDATSLYQDNSHENVPL